MGRKNVVICDGCGQEKDTEKAQKKLDLNAKDTSNALAWWKDVGNKKDSNLTTKEKLFKNDYQVYQSFSYLKAWKTLKLLAR